MDSQSSSDKGPSGRGANQGWKIEPEKLQRNYSPTRPPEVTHLLYEIQWKKNLKTWKNWCTSNPNQHAEINFLENAWKEIRRKTRPCSITWFLSWSPCHACSQRIIEFLETHPKVTLEIRAAQLFKHQVECNQNGLRDLANFGVKISIMHLPDYQYCWRTFVVPQEHGEEYWPWHFFPRIISCSQSLCSILKVRGYLKN
ncbi:C-_U-editing enzyme APOBEC-1-like [Sceloporus undulatus]|uniref:C->U-editing enzyme APOBEC-1-like n=1 Tax=Sceloporus undulatus TaxID=8520 RepID=UPI001C4B65A2|nr:C->U-editing enzyme APOBEC-1-like [Sceloporus undulatus]